MGRRCHHIRTNHFKLTLMTHSFYISSYHQQWARDKRGMVWYNYMLHTSGGIIASQCPSCPEQVCLFHNGAVATTLSNWMCACMWRNVGTEIPHCVHGNCQTCAG